jgi:hypothetical protein
MHMPRRDIILPRQCLLEVFYTRPELHEEHVAHFLACDGRISLSRPDSVLRSSAASSSEI